jgi:hypothetical protein
MGHVIFVLALSCREYRHLEDMTAQAPAPCIVTGTSAGVTYPAPAWDDLWRLGRHSFLLVASFIVTLLGL